MAVSTKDYASVLNDLIETNKDAEQGFRQAAEGVKNPSLQKLFLEYSRQRSQHAAELQVVVARIGQDPEKSGSVSGAMHRGWMNMKSAVTGKDDHAILAEAERGEDIAVKAYQDALGKELPTDLRSIVNQQYQTISQAHNKIRSLRDGSEYGEINYTPDLEETRK